MENSQCEPIAIHRACGGWLVVAAPEAPIRMGVIGASEEAAREKYQESLEKWEKIPFPKVPTL